MTDADCAVGFPILGELGMDVDGPLTWRLDGTARNVGSYDLDIVGPDSDDA